MIWLLIHVDQGSKFVEDIISRVNSGNLSKNYQSGQGGLIEKTT